MISNKSLSNFLLTCQLGLFLGILPIYWENKEYRLVNLFHGSPYVTFGYRKRRFKFKKIILWRVYYAGVILSRFAFLPFAIYFLVVHGDRGAQSQASELSIGILAITNTILGIISLSFGFFSCNFVMTHVNRLLKLNQQMCKLTNLDTSILKDGTETKFIGLLITSCLLAISLPPAFTLAAKHRLPFFRFFNIGEDNVVFATFWAITYLFDIASYFGNFGVISLHLNSTGYWLKRLSSEASSWPASQRRMIYRRLQILHEGLSDFLHYFVPIYFPVITTSIIFAIFISIRLWESLNFPTLSIVITTAVTCLFWIHMNCNLCCRVSKYSAIYCRGLPKRTMKGQEQRHLHSCRPLNFKVAELLSITNSTFPSLVHFINVCVINLLVLT